MSRIHLVIPGDSVASLASAYGHFPGTIWNHPENAALKASRVNMNILAEGDAVFIPEIRPKREAVKVDKVHRFRRRGVPATFRLRLCRDGVPRSGLAYRLEFDGMTDAGTIDEDGVIEAFIPPSVREIRLYLGDSPAPHVLAVGRLEPETDLRGLQQRLQNLGFDVRVSAELDDATRTALATVQREAGLSATGEPDAPTREVVRKAHDRVGGAR